jgi:hypothetical protein
MFRRSIWVMIVLAAFALTQAGCADKCPPTTFRVEGDVLHPEGGPIPNAVIEITTEGTEDVAAVRLLTVTDEDGHFKSDELTLGECKQFKIGITATRYVARTITYSVPGEGEDADVENDLPDTIEIVLLPAK